MVFFLFYFIIIISIRSETWKGIKLHIVDGQFTWLRSWWVSFELCEVTLYFFMSFWPTLLNHSILGKVFLGTFFFLSDVFCTILRTLWSDIICYRSTCDDAECVEGAIKYFAWSTNLFILRSFVTEEIKCLRLPEKFVVCEFQCTWLGTQLSSFRDCLVLSFCRS